MADRPETLDDFLTRLDEAQAESHARECACRKWLGEAAPAIADHLTETMLPPDLRAAGMRIEWGGDG